MMGGSADVVGWQRLLNSHVTLGGLQSELADAGVQAGTPAQLLDAKVTLAQLAQATAGVLGAKGDSNASLYTGRYGIVALPGGRPSTPDTAMVSPLARLHRLS